MYMYVGTSGNAEGRGRQAYEQGYYDVYINRHCNIGVYWILQKNKKENKKVVMNIEQNTKHAARATQVERQVKKKAYTHDKDSQKQANRQGMCVRESEATIGKDPRLGIHTVYMCTHTRIHIYTHTHHVTHTYIHEYIYVYKIRSVF